MKIFERIKKWQPRRLVIISGPFTDEQIKQMVADINKIKKSSNVMVVNGSEKTEILKVWI